jgi:hypothetical protein
LFYLVENYLTLLILDENAQRNPFDKNSMEKMAQYMLTVKAEYRFLAIFHYTQQEDFYRVHVEHEEYQRYDELKSNEKPFLCSFLFFFATAVDHNEEYGNKKQYLWNSVAILHMLQLWWRHW